MYLSASLVKNTGALTADRIFKWSLTMSIDAVVDHVPQWYVVHTNPKQEDRAYSNLRCWGVETLHPKNESATRERIYWCAQLR